MISNFLTNYIINYYDLIFWDIWKYVELSFSKCLVFYFVYVILVILNNIKLVFNILSW